MLGRDVAVTTSTLADETWDYVALGHIHKHQSLNPGANPPVVYSGSLERIDFGEEAEAKGFCWVELTRGHTQWTFVPVHARPFKTLRVDIRQTDDPTQAVLDQLQPVPDGSVVRVLVSLRPDQQAGLRDREIEAALPGAASFSLVRQVEIENRARLGDLAPEALTPEALVRAYFEARNTPAERIELLLSSARELIQPTDARIMIPVELRMHNFLAYKDPDPLRLEGIHIACLAGPNGAGKSSILDAITWCVWGKARSNSADELIHQGQEEMQVSLVFDQAGVRYRIVRQRTAGKRGASLLEFQAWDEASAAWQPISEGAIRETQAKIDQTLNLDYETFVNSALLVQGRADEFTTKTPSQRKQVLASILGLSQWEVYEGRAKARIQEVRAAIQRLEGRLEEVEKELGQEEAHQEELESAESAASEISERLGAVEKQWSDLEQTRSQLVGLQRQLDDLARRIASRKQEIREVQEERDVSLARADRSALGGAIGEIRNELETLIASQETWEELSRRRAEAAETAAKLQGMNQTLGPETEPLKARAKTLEQATDPICPTCGQPLTEDHRHQLVAELTQEIQGRRQIYRENSEKIRDLEEQSRALDAELLSLKADLARQTELQRRLAQLETDLKHADESQNHVVALIGADRPLGKGIGGGRGQSAEARSAGSGHRRATEGRSADREGRRELEAGEAYGRRAGGRGEAADGGPRGL